MIDINVFVKIRFFNQLIFFNNERNEEVVTFSFLFLALLSL